MIIELVLLLIFLAVIFTDLYLRRRASRFIKVEETEANANFSLLPTTGDPLFRILHGFYKAYTSSENRLLRLHETVLNHSHLPFKMLLTMIFHFNFVIIWDAAAVKQVLFTKKTSFEKVRSMTPSFNELFSESLVMVSGDQWHKQRTLMKPSFSFDRLKTLVPIFYQLAHRLCDSLIAEQSTSPSNDTPSNKKTDEPNTEEKKITESNQKGVDFDPSAWMSRLTLDGLGLGGFGFNFGAIDGQNQKEYEVYHNIMQEFTNPLRIIPFYDGLNTERNRKHFANMTFLKQFLLEVIEKKKKANEEAHKSGGKDLLDLMIQHSSLSQQTEDSDEDDGEIFDETEARDPTEEKQKKQQKKQQKKNENKDKKNKDSQPKENKEGESKELSDRELAHNLFLFFLAGHETSSSALSLMLAMLAKHQDAQEKLRKEIESVSAGEEEFSSEMISKLEYLNLVLKESMRLHPPVAAISRNALEDTEINGFLIPKNSRVLLMIYSIQRDKQIWGEDAEEFRPERFDKKNMSQRCGTAYMPFGSGERSCLGINFALLEMKTSLCCLLKRFRFEEHKEFPVDEMKYDNQITLRTPAGFKLRAIPLSSN